MQTASSSTKRKLEDAPSADGFTCERAKKLKLDQPDHPRSLCSSTQMRSILSETLPSDCFPNGVLQIVCGYLTPFLVVKPHSNGVTIHDAFSDETIKSINCDSVDGNFEMLWNNNTSARGVNPRGRQFSVCPVDSGRVIVIVSDESQRCAFRMLNLYTLSWDMSTSAISNQKPEYGRFVGPYSAIVHPMTRAIKCVNSWMYRRCQSFKWIQECQRMATLSESGVVLMIDFKTCTSYPVMLPSPVEPVLTLELGNGSIVLESRSMIYVLSASFPHTPLGLMSKMVRNAFERRPPIPPMPLTFACALGSQLVLVNCSRYELVVWDPCSTPVGLRVFNLPRLPRMASLKPSWFFFHHRQSPSRIIFFDLYNQVVYALIFGPELQCNIRDVLLPASLSSEPSFDAWQSVSCTVANDVEWFCLQTTRGCWYLQVVENVENDGSLSLGILWTAPGSPMDSIFVLLP